MLADSRLAATTAATGQFALGSISAAIGLLSVLTEDDLQVDDVDAADEMDALFMLQGIEQGCFIAAMLQNDRLSWTSCLEIDITILFMMPMND
jgi:hypothetical protein